MAQSDASHAAAREAVERILAGIKIVITDDISQYRETLEPLIEGLEIGGAPLARERYLLLKSLIPWLKDEDEALASYPDYDYVDVITEDDLRNIYSFDDNDFGEVDALIYLYRDRLRYVVGEEWFIWTGARWKYDGRRAIVQYGRLGAKIRLKAAFLGLEDAGPSDAARDKALARIRYSSSRINLAPIERALKSAASDPRIVLEAGDLDRDKFKLGVTNGVLDLRTGALIPPDPNEYMTKQTNIAYFPEASCPRWLQFLQEVFQNDEDLIEYIQRFVGYCLTGDIREQYIWFGYGMGSNGKGVFVEILLALLGDYSSPIDFRTLMQGGETEKGEDIAPLRGKRFIAASESEKGKRLNEALVKKMTGGDSMRVRHLYGDMFDFIPEWKIFAITNHKPVITGTDRGIWRRMVLIPFTASFEGKPDLELRHKLKAELPGILAWAVEGCRKWLEGGLTLPWAIAEATTIYREEMDVLGGFLKERTVIDKSLHVGAALLYSTYQAWAEANGMDRPMTARAFKQALEERGYKQYRDEHGNQWRDLGLSSGKNVGM